MEILLIVGLALALCVGYAVALLMVRDRMATKAPRSQRKLKWLPSAFVFLFCLYFCFHNPNGLHFFITLAMGGFLLHWWLIGRDAPPDLAEARRNYEADRTRCGRCDYDLTGNTSGICPECGWKIPAPDSPMQDRNWAQWFSKWRIEHLDDDWRVLFRRCLLALAMFGAMAVGWALWSAQSGRSIVRGPSTVAIAFVIHFAINAYRVWDYGRRVKAGSADDGANSDRK